MKKRLRRILLVVFLSLSSHLSVSAWNEVQRFEAGLDFGGTVPTFSYYDGKAQIGACIGFSARYNIPHCNWSAGLEFRLNEITRKYNVVNPQGRVESLSDKHSGGSFLAIGEYSFNHGSKVDPFVGCGIGFSLNESFDLFNTDSHTDFCISPRAGVELFSHLRIGVGFHFTRKEYSGFSAIIGVVIGGRPKK